MWRRFPGVIPVFGETAKHPGVLIRDHAKDRIPSRACCTQAYGDDMVETFPVWRDVVSVVAAQFIPSVGHGIGDERSEKPIPADHDQ